MPITVNGIVSDTMARDARMPPNYSDSQGVPANEQGRAGAHMDAAGRNGRAMGTDVVNAGKDVVTLGSGGIELGAGMANLLKDLADAGYWQARAKLQIMDKEAHAVTEDPAKSAAEKQQAQYVRNAAANMQAVKQEDWNQVKAGLSKAGHAGKLLIKDVASLPKDGAEALFNLARAGAIKTGEFATEKVAPKMRKAWGGIRDFFSKIFDGLKSFFQAILEFLKRIFTGEKKDESGTESRIERPEKGATIRVPEMQPTA